MKKTIIILALSFIVLNTNAQDLFVESTPEQIEQQRIAALQEEENLRIQSEKAIIKYNTAYQEAVTNLNNKDLGKNTYIITEQMIFSEMERITEVSSPQIEISTATEVTEIVVSTSTGLGEDGFSAVGLLGLIAAIGGTFLILKKLGLPIWLIILIIILLIIIIILAIKKIRKKK